jgi:type II secretory ATPase GspE/PulE/Tfp pilus assembly ATPase PilB-like protein
MQSSPLDAIAFQPRSARIVLRDGSVVEGDVHVTPGTSLARHLSAAGAWVNLTNASVPDRDEPVVHTAMQTGSILWAASLSDDLPVGTTLPDSSPRPVELALDGGMEIAGTIHLPSAQRLSDFLEDSGPFLPLFDATLALGTAPLGDLVVSRSALHRIAELEPQRRGRGALAGGGGGAFSLVSSDTGVAVEPRIEAPAAAVAAPAAAKSGAALAPMRVPNEARHQAGMQLWLVSAAERAGLRASKPISLTGNSTARAVWAAVAAGYEVDELRLAGLVATHFGVKTAELDTASAEALALVPERVARRYRVVPLRVENRRLIVAGSDPLDLDAENALRFATGHSVAMEIAAPSAIDHALDALYESTGAGDLVTGIEGELAGAVRVVEEVRPEVVQSQDVEAAPVIRLANLILRDAVRQNASDVHIEPVRGGGAVRFRVDGVLRPYIQMPVGVLHRVVSRYKVMAELDIADRMRPQDGRARVEIEGKAFDMRLSTVPTRDAEKAVIRILNPQGAKRLEDVGLPDAHVARIRQLLTNRSAIILVSGPTGSGKTTTLYAGLREVATGEVNVMSVEDPVEYEMAGVTQIQVETRRNVTFASALRAILRQDPDVIFVGEIRDPETAKVAVQASMTGHLVLATVHTNDAASAATRLCDLGVDRAAVASALRGVVAQRLVRRICNECAQPVNGKMTEVEKVLAERFGTDPVVRPVGCMRCSGSGYNGRIPLAEVLMVNAEVEGIIATGGTIAEVERAGIANGMQSLREGALERVRAGETSLQEVERVLGEGASAKP